MRGRTLLLRYFAVAIFTLLFFACNQKENKELLVGNWQFNNIKYEKEISPELQPMIDAQIASLRQSYSVTFRADGTYRSSSLKETKTENGTWTLSDDGKLLENKTENGTQAYQVIKLNEDTLFLKSTVQSETLTLQFTRNK